MVKDTNQGVYMDKKAILKQVSQDAYNDELQKIASDIESLQRKAEKSEMAFEGLKAKYPGAYKNRNIGAIIGAALGAGGGAAIKKGIRAPLGAAGGLLGLLGGAAIGHAASKASNPQFANEFESKSRDYHQSVGDFAEKYQSLRRPSQIRQGRRRK